MNSIASRVRDLRNGLLAILSSSAVLGGCSKAEGTKLVATDERANAVVVDRAFQAWAAGTGSPYDLLAEDVVWTITGNSMASKTYNSKAAFMGEVIQPFNARMKVGLKPTVRNLYPIGDTVVVLFDASGTAADDRPYTNTYAWFLTFRNGQIAHSTAFFDSIAFNDLWTRLTPASQ